MRGKLFLLGLFLAFISFQISPAKSQVCEAGQNRKVFFNLVRDEPVYLCQKIPGCENLKLTDVVLFSTKHRRCFLTSEQISKRNFNAVEIVENAVPNTAIELDDFLNSTNVQVPPIPYTESDKIHNTYKYLSTRTVGAPYFRLRLFTSSRMSRIAQQGAQHPCGDIPPYQWITRTLGVKNTKNLFITVNINISGSIGGADEYSSGPIPIITIKKTGPRSCETNIVGTETLTPLLPYRAGTAINLEFKVHNTNETDFELLQDIAELLKSATPKADNKAAPLFSAAKKFIPGGQFIPDNDTLVAFSEQAKILEDTLADIYNDRFGTAVVTVSSAEIAPHLMHGRYLPAIMGPDVNDISGFREAQIAVVFEAVPSAFLHADLRTATPVAIYRPDFASDESPVVTREIEYYTPEKSRQVWLTKNAIKSIDSSRVLVPLYNTLATIDRERVFWDSDKKEAIRLSDAFESIPDATEFKVKMASTLDPKTWSENCTSFMNRFTKHFNINASDSIAVIRYLFQQQNIKNAKVGERNIQFSYSDGINCGAHLDQTAHDFARLMFIGPNVSLPPEEELLEPKFHEFVLLRQALAQINDNIKKSDLEGDEFFDSVSNLQSFFSKSVNWTDSSGVIFRSSGTKLEGRALAENLVGKGFSKFGCYIRDPEKSDEDPNRARVLGEKQDRLYEFRVGYETNMGEKNRPLITSVELAHPKSCEQFRAEHRRKGCSGGWKPWESDACNPGN